MKDILTNTSTLYFIDCLGVRQNGLWKSAATTMPALLRMGHSMELSVSRCLIRDLTVSQSTGSKTVYTIYASVPGLISGQLSYEKIKKTKCIQ